MLDDSHSGGANCTDETKRSFYKEALVAKIGEESAKATHSKKLAEYRNVLKKADKAGVDTDAITATLAIRFSDPDEELIKLRERVKMLDLSGFLPGIKDRLFSRLDIEEATTNEDHTMSLARAHDLGCLAGRNGHSSSINHFQPGTEEHVHFHAGWLSGQRAIADEMAEDGTPIVHVQPEKRGRGRPKKLLPDTAADVHAAIANDDNPGEPLPFGDILHSDVPDPAA